MSRIQVRLLVFVIAMACWPSLASAQWFVNPYIGKVAKPTFEVPIEESATILGVAGGTNPLKRLGVEIDFLQAKNYFGPEESEGKNKVRTLTVSAHVGHTFSAGPNLRIRPYFVGGGGLGILQRTDFFADFDFIETLPPAQRQAIFNCLFSQFNEPTRQQIIACGAPVASEEEKGYAGVASLGGGAIVFFSNNIGARVDFRKVFHVPADDDQPFHFWRLTVGVVISR